MLSRSTARRCTRISREPGTMKSPSFRSIPTTHPRNTNCDCSPSSCGLALLRGFYPGEPGTASHPVSQPLFATWRRLPSPTRPVPLNGCWPR